MPIIYYPHTRWTLSLRCFIAGWLLFALFTMGNISSTHAQNVGIGTVAPDASALLDMTSTARGLLIPRMTEAQKILIASPATGLLIYQTNNATIAPYAGTAPTFWYYTGSAWVPFTSNAWQILGNGGTTAGTNFVGTTDNTDLVFKTNAVEGMRLTAGSNLGIGTAAPTSRLHTVASGVKTASYIGNLLTNTATTSTASIDKYGLQSQSTGAWSGTSDTNVGLLVNATGGTTNYSALFEGGNVGVNTTAPATSLDISGDFSTRQFSYTASNGNNNNINVGAATFIRFTGPTASFSITGVAGGVDGKILILFNSTTQQITLSNESANSSAANRIWTLNNTGDIVINGKGAVKMVYSTPDSRWLVISEAQTVSTSSTGVTTVKKPVDQSVTNSTTLINDNDLKIPINANDSIVLEGAILANVASTAPGIQLAWTIPAGATMDIGTYADDVNCGSEETFIFTTSGAATPDIQLNAGDIPIHFWGIVITGGTSGNIQLQWAQGASSATSTTLKALSYIRAYYIR